MKAIDEPTLAQILSLRDQLRELDGEVVQEIAKLEAQLRELQLGIPIPFGEFTWAKHNGRWALWDASSLLTDEPRDAMSTPRAWRVAFLEWLGPDYDLGLHVVSELSKALDQRWNLVRRQ